MKYLCYLIKQKEFLLAASVSPLSNVFIIWIFTFKWKFSFEKNHLSCLQNSHSRWLPFGTLKLNSGSIRLLCLSPRRIFRLENPWLFAHLLNTLGLRRTQAARKSNIKYLIMQKSMTIHVCMSANLQTVGEKTHRSLK